MPEEEAMKWKQKSFWGYVLFGLAIVAILPSITESLAYGLELWGKYFWQHIISLVLLACGYILVLADNY